MSNMYGTLRRLSHASLTKRSRRFGLNGPEQAFLDTMVPIGKVRGWSIYPQVSMPHSRQWYPPVSDFVIVYVRGFEPGEPLPPSGMAAIELDGTAFHTDPGKDGMRDRRIYDAYGIRTWRGPSRILMTARAQAIYGDFLHWSEAHLAANAESIAAACSVRGRMHWMQAQAQALAARIESDRHAQYSRRLASEVDSASGPEWYAARAAQIKHSPEMAMHAARMHQDETRRIYKQARKREVEAHVGAARAALDRTRAAAARAAAILGTAGQHKHSLITTTALNRAVEFAAAARAAARESEQHATNAIQAVGKSRAATHTFRAQCFEVRRVAKSAKGVAKNIAARVEGARTRRPSECMAV